MIDVWLAAIIKHPKKSGGIGLVIVLACAGGLWWQLVWQNPQRAFEDMLSNSLHTTSVTKLVKAGNVVQGIDQTVRLRLGGQNAAEWLVAATQAGAAVTTDSIGTEAGGYIRYTHIENTATGKKSGNFDKALNVWAKSDGKTDVPLMSLLAETLLDITNAPAPPIANLPDDRRQDILAFMQNEQVFMPDYKAVKSETLNGHAAYTYTVHVHLAAYVRMMQTFAHDMGLTTLDTVDPNQYNSLAPLAVTMSVYRASHELAAVSYAQTGFSQQYDGWNLLTPITIPSHAITTTALQARLQAAGS